MSITDKGLEKAAEHLFNVGQHHGWFGAPFKAVSFTLFKEQDPIGYGEWLDIVAETIEKAQG